jgi:CelD/BcsL family acetyltransferase involved in cellulose biosynthesis
MVRETRSAAAFLDLPATLDEFLRARQSRFRTRLRALLRRIDDGELVFEADADASTLRARLRSLFALHQRRWQAAGGPGVFGTRAKRMFYAHFAPRFARRGWLRLYSLRDASGYRAHQLCFGRNGITYLLQEGFDADDTSASFGQALRAAVVRDLIDRGERGYDFLGGFSRHKSDWGARETEVVHLVLGRRNLRGWLRVRAPQWREALAPGIKRALPPALVERLRRVRGRAAT